MPTSLYRAQTGDLRTILRSLGMGDFNITACIPTMLISVGTTDPDAGAVQLIVSMIQRRLNSLGHDVPVSGRLDPASLSALKRYTGPYWAQMTWSEVCQALIAASDPAFYSQPAAPQRARAQAMGPGPRNGLSGITDSVPGGALGLAAIAGVGLYFLTKRR